MYKWYQVLVQDLDENVDENLKDLDENLTWLTQKTKDPKGIKETLLSPHLHTVNVIELNCKVIKKLQPPISTSTPPFLVYPPFLAKNFVPTPKWLNFWKVVPPIPPRLPFNKGPVPTMKLNESITPISIPICKKAYPYLKSLKYILKHFKY